MEERSCEVDVNSIAIQEFNDFIADYGMCVVPMSETTFTLYNDRWRMMGCGRLWTEFSNPQRPFSLWDFGLRFCIIGAQIMLLSYVPGRWTFILDHSDVISYGLGA